MITCPHCRTEQHSAEALLGQLGYIIHYRCRYCGAGFHENIFPRGDTTMTEQLDIDRFATPTEKRIALSVVDALLAAGYLVEVFDGEETALSRCLDRDLIVQHLCSTGEDYLYAFPPHTSKADGWVRLIYGNGEDLISDYTTGLHALVQPLLAA